MSDHFHDSDPEAPRKGFGWLTQEQQRAEIQRYINKGYDAPWIVYQAKRFGIIRQEVDTTKGY